MYLSYLRVSPFYNPHKIFRVSNLARPLNDLRLLKGVDLECNECIWIIPGTIGFDN